MEVKKKNRNGVFRYICKQGTVSNPDISYALKMSLPTATQITKELIGEGLVEEKGELQSTGKKGESFVGSRGCKIGGRAGHYPKSYYAGTCKYRRGNAQV